MLNPLTRCVQEYALPPFAQLRPDDYAPALRTAMEELATDLEAIEEDLADPGADISWESLMDRLEIIDDPLDRLWGVVTHMSMVANVPELRTVQAELEPEVLAVQGKRAQSVVIYKAMVALRDSSDWNLLTPEQQRILHRSIQTATLTGVHLVGTNKARFNAIHKRLLELKTATMNNVFDASKAYSHWIYDKQQLDGVPHSTLSHMALNAAQSGHRDATAEKGPWKVSLEASVYQSILKHCSNRHLRQYLYLANNTKASVHPFDNQPHVVEMLRLRQEQAHLLGFPTYADLCVADKMAPSVDAVTALLEELRVQCFPIAQAERRQLETYAAAHNHPLPLEPWDISYWMEALCKETFDINDELVKPYFPLQRVLDGLFALAAQLFEIRIEAADGLEETWHSDVRFFQIRAMDQPDEPVMAQFYLDLFARPGDKVHVGMLNVVASRSSVFSTEKTPVRLPVLALLLNQSTPTDDHPTLMTFTDVHALFHSFGMVLRFALTDAKYTMTSGAFSVERDAVDVPATMFSYFCTRRETMALISGHYVTGEPLPDKLFESMIAAKQFMAATTLLQQVHFAALDLALHQQSVTPSSSSLSTVRTAVANKYKWAEVQALDAYTCFTETQGDQTAWNATGRRFRRTFLAMTGVCHPSQVFESFCGRQHNTDAMLRHYGLKMCP
ncbi:hypothetical protein, variant [Aphanomyces astaci]|uniref:oligopeptidase A n=1 Tax=Aphanomyces astaci TaxID=112090 RepID=W4H153_APHAT|nr:hypothetical protein, variant [Aphanomyces astaci]ETV85612.1 hypothetical protein, variant [Aphanomyces astaci]|eukprot:XP_009825630.1 hypothetical protein, variant [Aphanomyces astaci]